MGLFDKKYCNICNAKIGLLGNRKLEDGNCCKDCAKKLSPWFDDRRHSTVEQISAQIAQREQNKNAVQAFHTTRTFGENYILQLDEDAHKFMVTRTGNLLAENPDVLDYAQVTGCELTVDEDKREEMREIRDTDGSTRRVSYNPPHYTLSYDFYVVIRVNHPFFNEMRFQLNSQSVELELQGRPSLGNPALRNPQYVAYQQMGQEIKSALMDARQQVRDMTEAANAPKQAVICSCCGATTTPDAGGCCEYCGGPARG